MSQVLSPYNSQSESEEENIPPKKRVRQTNLQWELKQSFASYEEAEGHVNGLQEFNLRTHSGNGGLKKYYDCKYSRNCIARIYLHLVADSHDVHLYQTIGIHDHVNRIREIDDGKT
jgi:hypothetical protein